MVNAFNTFELVVRRMPSISKSKLDEYQGQTHPFDERNIHPQIQNISKKLFDDGHYALSTFEAYKLLDKNVSTMANSSESGVKLMQKVFSENAPLIKLNKLETMSEKDEQKGYGFIFSGSMMAIRNPRGHECGFKESPTECLDYLSLASLLLRRLESALN